MAINKKLIHFATKENFDKLTKATSNSDTSKDILYNSICFIKNTNQIWTHGSLYNCGNTIQNVKGTSGWLRIGELSKRRDAALLHISNMCNYSQCRNVLLYIYTKSNTQVDIQQLGGFIGDQFQKVRVVYKSSDVNSPTYIEILYNTANFDYLDIASYENGNLVKIYNQATVVEEAIPEGYKSQELTLQNGINVTNIYAEQMRVSGALKPSNSSAQIIATQLGQVAVGDNTTPVYLNSSGKPVASTNKVNKTVPSDAVFTDTHVTDVAYHYIPPSGSMINVPTPTTTLDYGDTVVVGLNKDKAGHVTSLRTASLPSNYSLPLASSTTRGGVKIGYTQNGKNYPVQLSSEKMYVNVPWTNTTYSNATTSTSGLMSSDDKSKLDGIKIGAEVNQNAYSNIKVDTTTISADTKTDTLTLKSGDNIVLTPNASTDTVTIKSESPVWSARTIISKDNIPTAGGWIRIAETAGYVGTGILSITNGYNNKATSNVLLFVGTGHYNANDNNTIQYISGSPNPNFTLARIVYPNTHDNTTSKRYIEIYVNGNNDIYIYLTNNHGLTLYDTYTVGSIPTDYISKQIYLSNDPHKIDISELDSLKAATAAQAINDAIHNYFIVYDRSTSNAVVGYLWVWNDVMRHGTTHMFISNLHPGTKTHVDGGVSIFTRYYNLNSPNNTGVTKGTWSNWCEMTLSNHFASNNGLTSIPPIPSSSGTYTLKSINGKLTWS